MVCPVCHLEGKTSDFHGLSHSYQVVLNSCFAINDSKWLAYQEVLLLEGIQIYGYGNWDYIQKHIVSYSRFEVEKHFDLFFRKDFLHSEMKSFGKNNFKALYERILMLVVDKQSEALNRAEKEGINIDEKGCLYGQVMGYMPLRKEFDVEFDNEAELLLAEMEFDSDDSEEEIRIKKSILSLYELRLREREKRRNFVIERGLLDIEKRIREESVLSKEEKEVRGLLKPILRFQTDAEHKELINCLMANIELKRKWERLNDLQKAGVNSVEDLSNVVLKSTDYLELKKRSEFLINPKKERVSQKNNLAKIVNESKEREDNSFFEQEIDLCRKIDLPFETFLFAKEVLVLNCLKQGNVSKDEFKGQLNIDEKSFGQIYDFLLINGLIVEK